MLMIYLLFPLFPLTFDPSIEPPDEDFGDHFAKGNPPILGEFEISSPNHPSKEENATHLGADCEASSPDVSLPAIQF
jgi:hypothetical protein